MEVQQHLFQNREMQRMEDYIGQCELAVEDAFFAFKIKASEMGADFDQSFDVNEYELTATAYNFVKAQTDSTPEESAFGKSQLAGIAVSRDLLNSGDFWPGDACLIVTSTGRTLLRYVNDTLHQRKKRQIDIPMKTSWLANHWGRQQVRVTNLSALRRDMSNLLQCSEEEGVYDREIDLRIRSSVSFLSADIHGGGG